MWSRDRTEIGRRMMLLLGQFLVLIICISALNYAYHMNINPDRQVIASYVKTECFLLSKKLTTKDRFVHLYRADFRISYTVDNVQYTKWVSGNGLDNSFTRHAVEQENILSQFEDGGTYPCWYNPDDPGSVVLLVRKNWTSTFPLIVPTVIFVFVFYYFIKSVDRLRRLTLARRSRNAHKRKLK